MVAMVSIQRSFACRFSWMSGGRTTSDFIFENPPLLVAQFLFSWRKMDRYTLSNLASCSDRCPSRKQYATGRLLVLILPPYIVMAALSHLMNPSLFYIWIVQD